MWSRLLVLIYLFLQSLLIQTTFAQDDLFSYRNSLRYVNYLEQSAKHQQALIELERLHFMHPSNDSLLLLRMKNYRLAGEPISGINLYQRMGKQSESYLCREYVFSMMSAKLYKDVGSYLNNESCLNENYRYYFSSANLAFQSKPKEALSLLSKCTPQPGFPLGEMNSLLKMAADVKYKSPFLAGAMSAVVPGSGKVYTGDWPDGLLSFIFVGATGFQAYRGFRNNGVNSLRGWIFSSLCFGFYTGNIYGSVKSATRKNKTKTNRIIKSIEELVYTTP
jgi:hypothetical protein